MELIDDIARINKALWETGGDYSNDGGTIPRLNVDRNLIREFAEGKRGDLPEPFNDSYSHHLTQDVAGKRVLCLASGGGQQSVLFSLLGGEVTVLDLSTKQLAADRLAAEHYGYNVKTVEGDMRDLSVFDADYFDIVVQGVSIVYVPDVRAVFREVARVLKPGGWYENCYMNPSVDTLNFTGDDNKWDGRGYLLVEPCRRGAILMRADGTENMTEGVMTGEFRHLLSDIFNGLVAEGLAIKQVTDIIDEADLSAEPGSNAHMSSFCGQYFRIAAQKQNSTGAN